MSNPNDECILRQFELVKSEKEINSNTLVSIGDPVRIQRTKITKEERDFIWKSLSGQCYLCQMYLPRLSSWHIEHVVAFSSNPSKNDVLGNMLPACQGCNQKKGKKSLKGIADDFTFNIATRAKYVSHLHSDARNAIIAALDIKHNCSKNLSKDILEDAISSTINLIKQRTQLELDTKIDSSMENLPLESIRMEQLSDIDATPFAHGSFGEVYSAIYKDLNRNNKSIEVAIKVPRFACKHSSI